MASSPVLHFIILYFRAVFRTVAFLIVNSRTESRTASNAINSFKEYLLQDLGFLMF